MFLSHLFKQRSVLFCAGLSVILITGCGGDDNPTGGPNSTKHTVPNPGSTYIFEGYNVDSTETPAGTTVVETDKNVIWIVTQNGLTHKGKTGVVKIIGDSRIGMFYHSPNGDLIATPDTSTSVLGGIWVTYPFGSRSTFNYPVIDTVVPAQGGTTRIRISGTVIYLGEEDVVVGNETIRAQKVLDKMTQITEQSGVPVVTLDAESTLWYSPKVGYFVKQYTVTSTTFGTFEIYSRASARLTSYLLR